MTAREWLGAALLLVWLGATGIGFWWFEGRGRTLVAAEQADHWPGRAEARKRLATLGHRLARAGESGMATLMHFSKPGCRCNADADAHLAALRGQYRAPGLRLLEVELGAPGGETFPVRKPLRELVFAAPLAALFDRRGRLLYFGPYSSGPVCGSGINFVDRRLSQVRAGDPPEPWINDIALGCFCRTGRSAL